MQADSTFQVDYSTFQHHVSYKVLPAYRSTTVSPLQLNEAILSFSVMFPNENIHLVMSNSYLKYKSV